MTTAKARKVTGKGPTRSLSLRAATSSSPCERVGMQPGGDDSPGLPPRALSQDYHVVLRGCDGLKDDCIASCQTANWLAGHLVGLIHALQALGYIDAQGYIVNEME